MLRSVLLGGIAGGIVLHVWSTISWMVLPWHNTTIGSFQNEDAVLGLVQEQAIQSGVYFAPGHAADNQEAQQAKMKSGPRVFAVVRTDGMASMGPSIAKGVGFNLLSALLVTWLLAMTDNLSYAGKLLFLVVFGLAASCFLTTPYWIWWGFSSSYILVAFADALIGWLLAGLVIAKLT
ncbi:MAG: hypothetical protein O2923_14245 [Verrucomicrobia bacterium]|nr:hypothetical protein [Verrucomicrobiota bacterium]MDA1088395.1 hypothetical protein [Verrucomicrobiota bacterium]